MSSQDYELSTGLALKAARNRFTHLPKRVNGTDLVIPITKRGRPVMALMSWELFEALVESLEIMSDNELMGQIRSGEIDIRGDLTVSISEVMDRLNGT